MGFPEFMQHAYEQKQMAKMRARLKDMVEYDRKTITEPRGSNVRYAVGGSDTHQERAQGNSRGQGSNFQHRDMSGTGQFVRASVPHSAATNVAAMRAHLIQNHGVSPVVAGSLIGPSLDIRHNMLHASGADHGIG
jgi:hypothetical protein